MTENKNNSQQQIDDHQPIQVGMVLVHRVPLDGPNWAIITSIGTGRFYKILSPNEYLNEKIFHAEDNRWIRFPPR